MSIQMKRKFLASLLWVSLCLCLKADTLSEDHQILLSSDAFHRGDFATAQKGYMSLYKQTNKVIYAKEAAISAASLGDIKTAMHLAMLYQKITNNHNDISINKILVDGYAQMGQIDKAIELLQKIRKEEKTIGTDNVLGTLYLSQKRLDKAFPLLNKFYNQVHDEDSLEKLITIYFLQNRKKEALDLLQSHIDKYGCSEQLCQKALNTFTQFNELDLAKTTFARLYEKNPIVQNAQLYIGVLILLKEFDKAQQIAELFPFDRRLLLDLYTAQKKFAQASKQASLIYQEKKDPKFLGLEAIYHYESLSMKNKKVSKQEMIPVIQKLEQAIKERQLVLLKNKDKEDAQDAFFYNFLGYSLIDYGMDVKKGIGLVKKALALDSSSALYLDSLAWGYYKLGNCLEAKKIFSTISKELIQAEPELKEHYRVIQECKK
ncbi:tetratricopeptide repeat protein [Helicobacter cetorum]|uniref:ATP-dependent nuclease n=1 Tax=Helicobacter cetorum (strain ATCC BAA-540 / CCUG 52418 / MIT 99-5656) TaxID=1163745 RepID=I0ERB9_HELCM|nr:ATP-dependent nuclease subunit B [Helicobacter cetorum]AFI05488.1 ATP-dependent nuclease [Helicobacter cetorum MIT 99-5656]